MMEDIKRTIGEGMVVTSVVLAISVMSYSVFLEDSEIQNYEITEIQRIDINSCRDNIAVEGHPFILGTGRIDSDLYFFFTTGSKETGFKVDKINSSEVRIFYSDTARIDIIISEPILSGWFAEYFLIAPSKKTETRLYVPEGTIKEEFSIDSK